MLWVLIVRWTFHMASLRKDGRSASSDTLEEELRIFAYNCPFLK